MSTKRQLPNKKPIKVVVQTTPRKRISFPAISISTRADTSFYVSAIPASVLFSVCTVSRADEDPKRGYQRLLGKTRAKAIAQYLNDGKIIPGAIILSAQAVAAFTFEKKNNSISFDTDPRAFLVIDGQHRLYGGHEADHPVLFPVSILTDLDLEAEAQYFNDINGSQKGVPRTLQLEIEKFTAPKESSAQLRIKLFHELNTRPDSPLANRLSATKSVPGKLTHVPFKAAIEPLIATPLFERLSFEQKVQLLLNFLKALEDVLVSSTGTSQKLFNAAFFQAVFAAFPGIVQEVLERHQNYRGESFREVISPLEEIDWAANSGTNRVAIEAFTKHIVRLIAKGGKVSDDLLK